jgi:hypothetical protein
MMYKVEPSSFVRYDSRDADEQKASVGLSAMQISRDIASSAGDGECVMALAGKAVAKAAAINDFLIVVTPC